MVMAVARALLLLMVASVGANDSACQGAECTNNNDADTQVLLQSKVIVAAEEAHEAKTIQTVDDIDMLSYGLLQEHLDKAKTRIIAGVPVFNYGDTYEGGMNPSLIELAEQKDWIVDFADSVSDSDIHKFCSGSSGNARCKSEGHPSEGGVPVAVFKGSHAELEAAIKKSSKKPRFVESDQPVYAIPEIDVGHMSELMGASSSGAPSSWGLDRIDDAKGLDNDFSLPTGSKQGQGVHVYVADTGIYTSHSDFEGRAVPAIDTTSGSLVVCKAGDKNCALDKHGHGTHCAGTVGGKKYGVAKKTSLYAAKVLSDSGSGSFAGIINSVDWVASSGKKPAVWSASLGGRGKMNSIEVSFQRALKAGVVVAVAAGNNNADACGYSPAFAPTAITVAASNRPGTSGTDPRASFSNYGSCVDLFAPGVGIVSASHSNPTGSRGMSGTSMSAPHVAGAAALFLSDGQTPQGLWQHMQKASISGVITDAKTGTPNRMLHVGSPSTAPPVPPVPPVPTRAPKPVPTPKPTPKPSPKPSPQPSPKPAPKPVPTPPGNGSLCHEIQKLSHHIDRGLAGVHHKIHSLIPKMGRKFHSLSRKLSKIKKLLGKKNGVPGQATYYQMPKGKCCCPKADRIKTKVDCYKAHKALGLKHRRVWTGRYARIQGGCSTRQFRYGGNHDLHWNKLEPGKARHDLTPVCKKAR